uniref:Uncharacterized protein n=1 Tax=Ovis aries TaxID=9940 RepID=A0AC11CXN7_SHEEP
MVAEKETLSLNKCPAKLPTKTKLLAQQPLPVHQPHSLVSEGFTVKAMMKNSVVRGPPSAGAFKERPTKPTAFRKFYQRGDFPIALEHDSKGNKIAWKIPPVGSSWFSLHHHCHFSSRSLATETILSGKKKQQTFFHFF